MSKIHEDDKPAIDHIEEDAELKPEDGFAMAMAGNVKGTTVTDRQAALEYAASQEPGLKPGSGRWFYWYFGVCLTTFWCGGDSGFDGTVMSSVNSMLQFQQYFGLQGADGKAKPATSVSIIFGVYTVGSVCAFFPNSILPDRIGRRYCMFLGNIVLIAGAVLAALAKNQSMFVGGRFLTGLGCGVASNGGKLYLTEVTNPASRGRYVGFLNSWYYIGQLLASGISIPMGRHGSNWAWRAPILLQAMFALLNVAFVLFLPESPRWLYANGKKELAVKHLAYLHTRNNDINSPMVQLEIQEIEEFISVFGADKRWWDFRALFNSAANRYRFGLCAMVSCWGQLSGNGLITYFLPTLLKQAGIINPDRQRVLNFVNSITSWMGALAGTAATDFLGRRPGLLFAEIACACGMLIVGALLSPAGHHSQTRANAGISFIFLFMVFFSYGWTPHQAVYPAEVLKYENRAKGLALQGWVTQVASCINTFGLPVALAKINYRVYFIFFAWDIVGILVIYFFAVETKRLSLEDMDEIFEAKHPKAYSLQMARDAKVQAKLQKQRRAATTA